MGNPGVEFLPINEWFIDETNVVSYKFTGNRKSGYRDWIGLYKDGFSSVDDYIIYEYVNTDAGKIYLFLRIVSDLWHLYKYIFYVWLDVKVYFRPLWSENIAQ